LICRAGVRIEALVDISARDAIAVVTRSAITREAAWGVDALGVWRAVMLIPGALVDVGAHKPIPLVAWRAFALEPAWEVGTGRVHITRRHVRVGALIDIDALPDCVALEPIGARAVKAAGRVGTDGARPTGHRVTLALVDILTVTTVPLEARVTTARHLVLADHTRGVLIADTARFAHAPRPRAVSICALTVILRHAEVVEANAATRANTITRHRADLTIVQRQAKHRRAVTVLHALRAHREPRLRAHTLHIAEVRLAVLVRATGRAIGELLWQAEPIHAREVITITRVAAPLTGATWRATSATIDVCFIAIGDAVKTTGARIEVGHPAKIHEIGHIDGSWHISHIAHIHPGAHVPRADHPLILEASEISAVVAGLSSV
jgi:hypothetical protein